MSWLLADEMAVIKNSSLDKLVVLDGSESASSVRSEVVLEALTEDVDGGVVSNWAG